MNSGSQKQSGGKRVVVVGAGGNIGSHLASEMARIPGIGSVTLIDSGVYEAKDIWGQAITLRDVGKWKALVQARRLRAINPHVEVLAITEPLERVPLGYLDAEVILSGLDSRLDRQTLQSAAWHLNVILIDGGVDGANFLARANVYRPGADSPCLECAWSQQDYEHLEQSYPCRGNAAPPATNAPSALGALAASLEALECRKLLSGLADRALVSRQVLLDAMFHKHYVTSYTRNPYCRFDHQIWDVGILPGAAKLCLKNALALGSAEPGDAPASTSLRVAGGHFVQGLTCQACGRRKRLLRLEASLRTADLKCGRCGGPTVAAGFDRLERLERRALSMRVLGRSLANLGLRDRDVISIEGPRGECHYELTMTDGDRPELTSALAGASDVTNIAPV